MENAKRRRRLERSKSGDIKFPRFWAMLLLTHGKLASKYTYQFQLEQVGLLARCLPMYLLRASIVIKQSARHGREPANKSRKEFVPTVRRRAPPSPPSPPPKVTKFSFFVVIWEKGKVTIFLTSPESARYRFACCCCSSSSLISCPKQRCFFLVYTYI